jgi:hypothetical protein
MAGVRKWMGGSAASNSFDSQKTSSKVDPSKPRVEVEPDTKSTGTVAAQLLDPSVSNEEELEYQRLVPIWPLSMMLILFTGHLLTGISISAKTSWTTSTMVLNRKT